MSTKSNLDRARAVKNDEFYTRYEDIEKEINAYYEYDKSVFRGKIILCPCDDHEWSNFVKFFATNFTRFGIKKLISTSYAKSSGNRQTTITEFESPLYDRDKHDTHGKIFILTHDTDGSGVIDSQDVEFKGYLNGDGDFNSPEVCALRDEADIIITNPPFSLFRQFIKWVGDKRFIVLGNMNAITYKEIFPLIKINKLWLGQKSLSVDMFFTVSEEYRTWLVDNKRNGSAYGIVRGEVMGRIASACWFTNVEHGKRYEELVMDTYSNNLKYNKKLVKKLYKDYGEKTYPYYDGQDVLEVPFVECIPSDYKGIMGVSITFMDKYNPNQFEIIGEAKHGSDGPLDLFAPIVKGKNVFTRLLIKRK